MFLDRELLPDLWCVSSGPAQAVYLSLRACRSVAVLHSESLLETSCSDMHLKNTPGSFSPTKFTPNSSQPCVHIFNIFNVIRLLEIWFDKKASVFPLSDDSNHTHYWSSSKCQNFLHGKPIDTAFWSLVWIEFFGIMCVRWDYVRCTTLGN